jgi:carbon storage regulator
MLVLSRQVGEKIVIGDDIEVTVVAINGNKIRIGVTAPESLSIHRSEVQERINRIDAIRAGLDAEVHGKTEFPPPEHGAPVG